MKKNLNIKTSRVFIFRTVLGFLAICAFINNTLAQQTAADTQIRNQASATYSDGNGNTFNTVSNTVTITVAKVGGLTITPDGQANPSVVPNQAGVNFTFRVTNVGNFTDQVRFLASGQSVRVIGPGTATSAVISGPNTNILTNSADVLHSLLQGGFVDVVVTVNISPSAAPGSTIQVFLGDATTGTNFDNVSANNSANEVRTVSTGAVNGSRESRGDITVTVDNDGLLRTVMNVPDGPVGLASNIVYGVQACNDGQRPLTAVPTDSTIYVVIPIPFGTEFSTGQTLPSGSQYSTTALSTPPGSAVWSNTAPGSLASVRRVRIPVGATIAAGTCSATFNVEVTITTLNATAPIWAIAEAFANNFVAATVTDQSGDSFTNRGDGNADFDEPFEGQPANPNQGIQQPTLLLQIGNVLIGPLGSPNANGPTSNNDDYTNRSVNTGIAGVAPGGVTTVSGQIVFINTVQNTGNANDLYTLTAPTVPSGYTVEISTDDGANYTTVSGGGSVLLAIPFGASDDIRVRVTAPAGQTVLTGFETVIRATSGITSANRNDTIDRLYTGFVRMVKSFTINNTTGTGAVGDAVPGAEVIYSIAYDNVSSTGGTGNSTLTASNVLITEDGSAAPNNWATFTDHVVGATDTLGGTITGDTLGSTVLTDLVLTLAPGQSGVFTFRRVIR
jgi:hypothetical protein